MMKILGRRSRDMLSPRIPQQGHQRWGCWENRDLSFKNYHVQIWFLIVLSFIFNSVNILGKFYGVLAYDFTIPWLTSLMHALPWQRTFFIILGTLLDMNVMSFPFLPSSLLCYPSSYLPSSSIFFLLSLSLSPLSPLAFSFSFLPSLRCYSCFPSPLS